MMHVSACPLLTVHVQLHTYSCMSSLTSTGTPLPPWLTCPMLSGRGICGAACWLRLYLCGNSGASNAGDVAKKPDAIRQQQQHKGNLPTCSTLRLLRRYLPCMEE